MSFQRRTIFASHQTSNPISTFGQAEIHFNSNGATATGGETWFKPGDPLSNTIAADIRNRFSNIGLSLHGPGPNAAVSSTRAGWLPFYSCSAILLEPLYVSNPDQARWIHQSG